MCFNRNMNTLDAINRKIVATLSINARATYAEIGKKARVHKDTAAYRIKKLEEEGIIAGYTTFFDFSRLGAQVYKLYVKWKGLNEREHTALLSYLRGERRVGWIVEGNGSWDMVIGFHTLSVAEFYECKLAFEQRFHEKIQNMSATTQIQAYLYSRNYLSLASLQEVVLYSSAAPAMLDEKDRTILQALAKNARASAIDLARTTHLSARTVAYRIRQLEKQKVLLQYRCSLDLSKIGRIFIKAFISLEQITPQQKKKIIDFFRQSPCVVHNVESLGAWELEPEFEVETIEQFYTMMNEFRARFAEHIGRIDSMLVSKEHKYQYVP